MLPVSSSVAMARDTFISSNHVHHRLKLHVSRVRNAKVPRQPLARAAKMMRAVSCANEKGRIIVDPARPILQINSGVVVQRVSVYPILRRIIFREGR